MKKTLCILAAILMVISLVSCNSVSKEDLVGTWSGAWTYNGNVIAEGITFYSDGNYDMVMLKNDSVYKVQNGDYEIKGDKVLVYNGDSIVHHGEWMEYTYKDGKLENNGHYLEKSF